MTPHPLVPYMDCADFCAQRATILPEIIALKQKRTMTLGPDMTVLFEHPRIVWWQIQEMVRIESQTPEQWGQEWEVYRHLLPSANTLTMTLTIEIQNDAVRQKSLQQRVGLEHTIWLEGAGYSIQSVPIDTQPEVLSSPTTEALWAESAQEDKEENKETAETEDGTPASLSSPGPQKTSCVHFLSFSFSKQAKKEFQSNAPVLTCRHAHALARSPMGLDLWGLLVQDLRADG